MNGVRTYLRENGLIAACKQHLHCLICCPYSVQEKKQRERQQREEEENEGADADMMALMGFGGFGSSKK